MRERIADAGRWVAVTALCRVDMHDKADHRVTTLQQIGVGFAITLQYRIDAHKLRS